MSKAVAIQKVLVIGSGPIVIGQSAEYDYAATQACRAFKEEGVAVVLVHSNPATISTERSFADAVYMEPLDVDSIKRIIERERPDSILPTVGGEKGMELCLELVSSGYLEEHQVRLLAVTPDMIRLTRSRQSFKELLVSLGEPDVEAQVVGSAQQALQVAEKIGYPVLVRPAYTLGGKAAVFCYQPDELESVAAEQLKISLIRQILVEKCISGWKEIEYIVMRDSDGNAISVCSLENIDPVGIHTGDSIVVAPAQTLTDLEMAKLRFSALQITHALEIQGCCCVRFALRPDGSEYAVLEAQPRAGRSTALASKATGYPVAQTAAKIALGYRLDQIANPIVSETTACNEPAIDYCAIKIPKWSFGRFAEEDRQLDASMKATGEVLAIGTSFELAFMKAVRSIGTGLDTPLLPKLGQFNQHELLELIRKSSDERIFAVYYAIQAGVPFDVLHSLTMIDFWFLAKLKRIADMETALHGEVDEELYRDAKAMGFLDSTICRLSGQETLPLTIEAGFHMVDTCAAEFDAHSPYFYSAWDEDNEAAVPSGQAGKKPRAIVVGSGPLSIGSGAELDYCTVHAVHALQKAGYQVALVNNNPGSVSTDFEIADRLYLDPLTQEDIGNILLTEQPCQAILQFGGRTAVELSATFANFGVPILGAETQLLHQTENIDAFHALLDRLAIPHTAYRRVSTAAEALGAADEIGYPVRIASAEEETIAYTGADITAQFDAMWEQSGEAALVIERYLIGTGMEMDVICDGENFLIPGVSEHIERAGIHSGDAISVYPPITLSEQICSKAAAYASKCATALKLHGIVNFQFVVYDNNVYLTQANVCSGRSIPYLTKVTGLPIVEIAVRCMLGEKLAQMPYGTGIYPTGSHYAVRVPVFSFDQMSGLDTQLGLRMKSTGEVLGIASTFEDALLKGLAASGMRIKRTGGVLITVRDSDKQEAINLADRFSQLNFDLYATAGTAKLLNSNCIATSSVRKIHEGSPNTVDLLESGKIDYVISTSAKGRQPLTDDVKIRRKAVERQIPSFTSLDTAAALVRCLAKKRSLEDIEQIDLNQIVPGNH